MKEALCFVSANVEEDSALADQTNATSTKYVLPDGHIVQVNKPRFEAPEILFDPALHSISA